MNTKAINAALRAKYTAPEWAIMFEVGDATGGRHTRFADAVAMNLYPSRGLAIHGFEVKMSRNDWQRELAQPDKSVAVQQFCNHWWIATLPGIIKDGELPPTWGHYELAANGSLVMRVKAPTLKAPRPVTREFVAAMLRRANEADTSQLEAIVNARLQVLRESNEKEVNRRVDLRTRDTADVFKRLADIKKSCGIDLTEGWIDTAEFGRAVKLVLASGMCKTEWGSIARLEKDLRRHADELSAALTEFHAATTNGK